MGQGFLQGGSKLLIGAQIGVVIKNCICFMMLLCCHYRWRCTREPVSSNITYAFACGNQLHCVHPTLIVMVIIQTEVIIVQNVWKVFPKVQPTLIWTMNLVSGKKANLRTLMIYLPLLEWYVLIYFLHISKNLHFQSRIDGWDIVFS